MRRSLSTSVATTGPPQDGHAPGALPVPTTRSSFAPMIIFTAPPTPIVAIDRSTIPSVAREEEEKGGVGGLAFKSLGIFVAGTGMAWQPHI